MAWRQSCQQVNAEASHVVLCVVRGTKKWDEETRSGLLMFKSVYANSIR